MTDPTKTHPLKNALDELGGSLKDWTVMHTERDPFRFDTPAIHRDCQWLIDKWTELGLKHPNHDRGLHYGLLGTPMPALKGRPAKEVYRNTIRNSNWLKRTVNRARWLEYVPWEWVREERNGDPITRPWEGLNDPKGYLYHEECEEAVEALRSVMLPDADGLKGVPLITDFRSPQPYHLMMFGEKTSLFDILDPIATHYQASLFLAKGDLTNPLIHECAEVGVEDGRPLVMLYFSDSDMSGWNMPIVLGRKLAAAKLVLFPELDFRIYRVGLRPDQVKELGLPQEPLKAKDKRGPAWFKATGTRATEIDALITQQPEALEQMAHDAIAPFFDATLDRRAREDRQAWQQQVRDLIAARTDLEPIRQRVADRMAEIKSKAEDLADEIEALSMEVTKGIELPPLPDLPEAEIDEDGQPEPLVDSRWSFKEQTEALLESKKYLR